MNRLINIPFAKNFLEELLNTAEELAQEVDAPPNDFSQMSILLPHRRACRALEDAFAQRYTAVMLPSIMPIGEPDVAEVMPDASFTIPLQTMKPADRAWILSSLLSQARKTAKLSGNPESDMEIALSLGSLIDRLQDFDCTLDQIKPPEQAELAEHWQWAAQFLQIVQSFWPAWLKENRFLDPVDARNQKLRQFIEQHDREKAIIFAGSSGRSVAVQEAVRQLLDFPHARVLLHGAELISTQALQEHARKTPTHPNYAQARLFAYLNLRLTFPTEPTAVFYQRVMQTASAQLDPQAQADMMQKTGVPKNIQAIEVKDLTSEIMTVAILAQQKWAENPSSNIAIITQDQVFIDHLARAVRRFGFQLDYSAGRPLNQTPAGRLAGLLLEVYLHGWSVVRFLAMLKHPMVGMGMEKAALRGIIDDLEENHLQGYHEETLEYLWDKGLMPSAFNPLREWSLCRRQKLSDWMIKWREDYALLTGGMRDQLKGDEWAFQQWRDALEGMIDLYWDVEISIEEFYRKIQLIIQKQRVPEISYGRKSLRVLSAMEARLLHFDRVIIPQMTADVYPPDVVHEPWLSRRHYAELQMPPPEESQGLAMHDWLGLLHQPEVILTRAERLNGEQLSGSIWWKRLEGYFGQMGEVFVDKEACRTMEAWVEKLLEPADNPSLGAPKTPDLPFDAKPRRLRVTDVETLFTNPYDLYVREILELSVRPQRFSDRYALEMGSAVHKVLEYAVKQQQEGGTLVSETSLLNLTQDLLKKGELIKPEFDTSIFRQQILIKIQQIAASWVEKNKEITFKNQYLEINCTLEIEKLVWRGKVDRLLETEQGWQIIDYKTGQAPRKKSVTEHFSWQLPLLGVALQQQGFSEVQARVDNLSYWTLSRKVDVISIFASGSDEVQPLLQKVYDQLGEVSQKITSGKMTYPAYPLDVQHIRPRHVFAEQLTRYQEWGKEILLDESDDA